MVHVVSFFVVLDFLVLIGRTYRCLSVVVVRVLTLMLPLLILMLFRRR